jgi:hypothetical protein
VGGLLDGWLAGAWGSRLDRGVTVSVAVLTGVFVLLGAAAAWLAGGLGGGVHLAGVLPAGVVIVCGGLAALGALVRRARLLAAVLLAGALIAAQWLAVAWTLPDFERYKPVPHLARVIAQSPVPPSAVGTYKVAAPSLVFYLRRHVVQMFDEEELEAFLAAHPDGVCVMPAEDYEAVKTRLPAATRAIASAPRFETRLADLLMHGPASQLVLVTASTPPVTTR